MKEPVTEKFVIIPELKKTIRLVADKRGLYCDEFGCVWELQDKSDSVDDRNVCGVGPIAVPDIKAFRLLNAACAGHDFLYSCPAYQYFHTRAEADAYLEKMIAQVPFWGFLAKPFRWIAEKFGKPFWEGR